MKILIVILVVISFVDINAQDNEPVQSHFNFRGSNNYYLNADSSYFQQKKFLLGWHWGASRDSGMPV